ncbi:uncharacterized protein LOC120121007 [Hibiscus syriacus]|uniref:uncharacterized protein LOC120121007 n=1 Tax=Hibiscus syriacus TaxID=106335 RepID=UPI001921CC19|nr:uncharacterized protein LOC120121007 [Hibiscus syriacus]
MELLPSNKVSTSLLLSPLVIPLLFACFAAMSFATASTATLKRHPGFLYSRTRGRCTPQFWSSRREAWPRMVPETSTVTKVFGSRAAERYGTELTLLEAVDMKEEEERNAFNELVREASVALLNSYGRKGFPYSAWEVKTLLIQGLVSEDAAAHLTHRFSTANDACL